MNERVPTYFSLSIRLRENDPHVCLTQLCETPKYDTYPSTVLLRNVVVTTITV